MELLQLAIDTSTSRPTAALLSGERCLYEWIGPDALKHHETLLAGIDECLKAKNVRLPDIAFLSVGVGPGMFTGLRIGVTTAKFLADPINAACVPVSSLVALSYQSGNSQKTWALNDAKSRRVYAYGAEKLEHDFGPAENEELALTPEEAAAKMKAGDFLVGEGALLYQDFWPKGIVIASDNILRASSIGAIGAKRYALGLT